MTKQTVSFLNTADPNNKSLITDGKIRMLSAVLKQGAEPVLDRAYSRIECVNCTAELKGNRVTLTNIVHGFTAAAFRVYA